MRPGHRPIRCLVVVSDQALVAECVRAALSSRGFDAVVQPFPAAGRPVGGGRGIPRQPDLGLLLCDLDSSTRVDGARILTAGLRAPWLLLTGTPRGPLWGAVLDGGVTAVMSTATTLDELVPVLHGVADGTVSMDRRERVELLREWWLLQHDRERRLARMRSLTPRERAVLDLLHEGENVRSIARIFGVKEATVRSQVRSVLHKLDVNSQLAAVAALGYLNAEERAVPRRA